MPPAKKDNVLPREGGAVNFQTKLGVLEWHGCIPDGGTQIPPGRLRDAQNIRFRRGRIIPRKGSRKLNATFIHATNAHIRGIVDFQVGTRRSLYVTGQGCPNLSGSSGYYLGYADQESDPIFGPLIYYDFATQGLVMGRFGGDMYLGQDNVLRKLQLIDVPFGQAPLAQSGSSQDVAVYTFTGFTKISALSEEDFSGFLFAGADNGAASKITVYDGLTLIDDLTGVFPPASFIPWRDSLIVGFDAGVAPDHIRVRAPGEPPGTYAIVAPAGSDTIGVAGGVRGVSYRDDAYLFDATANIFKYDGTTLVVTHVLPGVSIAKDMAVFDGYLFVAYMNGTNSRIARYDGATNTWVDVHKDLKLQDALISRVDTLEAYRDSLWAGVVKSGTGTHAYSPQYDTAGTWTVNSGVSLTNLSRSMVY